MPTPKTLAQAVLERVVLSGAKALGRAMESVLEDVGGVADGVSARTKNARGAIQNVGMGRPKPERARRRRAREHDEDE